MTFGLKSKCAKKEKNADGISDITTTPHPPYPKTAFSKSKVMLNMSVNVILQIFVYFYLIVFSNNCIK